MVGLPRALRAAGRRPRRAGGGDPRRNAEIILEVLGGGGNAGATNAVVLNAAAALYVGGRVLDFGEGVTLAREALRDGAGLRALERLREVYATT